MFPEESPARAGWDSRPASLLLIIVWVPFVTSCDVRRAVSWVMLSSGGFMDSCSELAECLGHGQARPLPHGQVQEGLGNAHVRVGRPAEDTG